jgi:ubiquinone/menaquinone biosynthesis C-methylase UbiE
LEKDRLNEAIHVVPKECEVLEVGAGTGRFSLHLEKLGYKTYISDLSKPMITICKDKFNSKQSQFIGLVCSSTHLPFRPETFGFVFSIRVLNQLSSPQAALQTIREMIRVCRKDGHVLIEFVNESGLSYLGRRRTTFLSVNGVKNLVRQMDKVTIENNWGILFFSQSVLKRIPAKVAPIFIEIDKKFCTVLKFHATRCYILLKKSAFVQ